MPSISACSRRPRLEALPCQLCGLDVGLHDRPRVSVVGKHLGHPFRLSPRPAIRAERGQINRVSRQRAVSRRDHFSGSPGLLFPVVSWYDSVRGVVGRRRPRRPGQAGRHPRRTWPGCESRPNGCGAPATRAWSSCSISWSARTATTAGELTLRWIGSHTVATLGPVAPARAAGLVIALASTVADLHDVGVVHGRIEPEHVVIGASDRPVLCGFGQPATPGDPAPSDDVAGLGDLLLHLLGDDPDAVPIPSRRLSGGRDGPTVTAGCCATWPITPPPTTPPPARRRGETGRRPACRRARRRPRWARSGRRRARPTARWTDGGATGSRWRSRSSPCWASRSPWRRSAPRPSTGPAAPTTGTTATTTGTTTTGSSTTSTTATTSSTTAPVRADTDGTVEVGGVRYAIGRPGDLVLVGDWGCASRPIATVLRPDTGEVFVFRGVRPGRAEPRHRFGRPPHRWRQRAPTAPTPTATAAWTWWSPAPTAP